MKQKKNENQITPAVSQYFLEIDQTNVYTYTLSFKEHETLSIIVEKLILTCNIEEKIEKFARPTRGLKWCKSSNSQSRCFLYKFVN